MLMVSAPQEPQIVDLVVAGHEDESIKLLWREGADTFEIAQILGVNECVVANRLERAIAKMVTVR